LDLSGGDSASVMFDSTRTEHAAVLVWWGRWVEAEKELLAILVPMQKQCQDRTQHPVGR